MLALDGTCIALAEHRWGELAGCANGLAMVVSTGIGGGFIIDSRPVTGTSGNAGHIGQIRVRTRDGADPSASTLEAIAAGPGIGMQAAFAADPGWSGDTLVVLSLRGGFDSLLERLPLLTRPAGSPLDGRGRWAKVYGRHSLNALIGKAAMIDAGFVAVAL